MSHAIRRSFDLVLVSDYRFPGGTSSSLATEIRAQAAAGYRTALIQVPAPLLKTPRPFNRKIRECLDEGLAELVLADEPLRAPLLVVRHPAVFSVPPPFRLNVESDQRVMVVNQVPDDGSQPQPYYDVATCSRTVERAFGSGFEWAPIGPLVRDALLPHRDTVMVSERDWSNVLRPEEWALSRSGFVSDRPVIGRHSRPHWRKWPERPEDILAAYPDDPGVRVRILGGADVPRRILGRTPSNWDVLPFDSIPIADFLASIDYFVYFHHSGLVEAFGRAVIEAVASGAVAILPHSFRRLFQEACVYGDPGDVRRLVDELYADPARHHAQARAGMTYVERNFSWQAHVRRVEERAGSPGGVPRDAPRTTSQLVLLVAAPGASGQALRELVEVGGDIADAPAVLLSDTASLTDARALGPALEWAPPDPHGGEIDAPAAALDRVLRTHRPVAAVVHQAERRPEVTATLRRHGVPWVEVPGAGPEGSPSEARQRLRALLGPVEVAR